MKIYKHNLKDAKPFVTKDNSIIRSILDRTNSPVKNESMAEAVLRKGKSTIEHVHKKSEEIYYFTQGTGVIYLNDKKIKVKTGDGVLISPGERHRLVNTGGYDIKILCLCSPPYSHEDTLITRHNFEMVIFDFDGTLVDSAPGIWKTANEMAKLYGVKPITMNQVTTSVGTGLDNFIEDLFPEQLEKYPMKTMIKTYRKIYLRSFAFGLKIFKNVVTVLKYLKKRKIKAAIVSNKLKKYVDEINKYTGIDKYFNITLGSESVKKMKPDPEAVFYIMRKYGLNKENILLVGDSQYDIETAKNAGVTSVFITQGYADIKKVNRLSPDYCFNDIGKLMEIL